MELKKGYWQSDVHDLIYGTSFKDLKVFDLFIEQSIIDHMRLFWISNNGNCDVYEFGVYTGGTLADISRQLGENGLIPKMIWGFDSFEGLPKEAYGRVIEGPHWNEGAFSASDALGIWDYQELERSILSRISKENVELIKGFYDVSLTRELFLDKSFSPAMFINVDCDLYKSTIDVLDWIFSNGIARVGTIIRYDDILQISEDEGELLAHKEMCEKYGVVTERLSTQYFLVTSMPEPKIKYAISSHIGSFEKTMSVCCDSLIKSGVDPNDIYFFVGGSDRYEQINNDYGVNSFLVDHNSFDFTGLISVLDLCIDSDYWFVLHDTVKVGNKFRYKIMSREYNSETVSLTSDGRSMNIGMYSMGYINRIKTNLMSFKNQDYTDDGLLRVKRQMVDTEDIFLHKSSFFNNSHRRTAESMDTYGTGVNRILEYFEGMDLYKFKANWEPKSEYELNL